jgi:hypothetical protein
MSLLALLNRTCDIWGVVAGNPEVEDSAVESESVVFPGVPCRIDSVLYSRRSTEVASTGGARNVKRATIFIQDPRLSYPENFDENNWIVEGGIQYKILTIDEADDMFMMHHYEVNCEAGRFR